METSQRAGEAEHRFRSLYAAHAASMLGYAVRRVEAPGDAADVVAETFLVAWRRLDEVPADDEARAWLFGVARRVLANRRRGDLRRTRLSAQLRQHLAHEVAILPAPAGGPVDQVQQALDRLDESDRELLRLTAWDGLKPGEVAVVLGLPAATVRTRLHRARRRLRAELEGLEAVGAEPLAVDGQRLAPDAGEER
jgi:RNA polymerase sigma-70 factor (ECF subfamily)